MIECIISGIDGRVSITVQGYENEKASDESDANWLSCKVVIRVGPFVGDFGASFTTQDILAFHEAVQEMLAGRGSEASFTNYEGALSFTIRRENDLGGLAVFGSADVIGASRSSLKFRFESDESYLREAAHSLQKMVASLPVRKATG